MLAEGLQKAGFDSRVLCIASGLKRGGLESINGVRVRRAEGVGSVRSMPISVSFLYWLWRESKDTDVLHVHLPFPLAAFGLWLLRPKQKLVVTWHSAIVRQKFLGKLVKPFVSWVLRRADEIIVTFDHAGEYYEQLRTHQDKITVIPLGVDLNFWKRAKLPENEKTHFIFVGRLVYYKGVGVLLDAFAQTDHGTLTIVGDGPLKERLEKKIVDHKLTERVVIEQAKTDYRLREIMHSADVLVLPSTHNSEVFGLVQLEAMASGLPVINTDLPTGVPRVSRNGLDGITVKPGSSSELVVAMRHIGSYGRRCVDRAREFSMQRMCAHHKNVYKKPRSARRDQVFLHGSKDI